jgi:hypothetical protein
MNQEHNCTKPSLKRDCHNCDRPTTGNVCPLPSRDMDTCLQNPSRPFWQPNKQTSDAWLERFNFSLSKDTTHNNGGSTDYYKFQPGWTDCQDIIESRSMNFSQGNIFKVAFCFNVGRHSAVTYERELNKIIWFAQRELERIKQDDNKKD